MTICKECGGLFEDDKRLHLHLRKHKQKVKAYYEKHYSHQCLQSGKKILWKNGDNLQSYMGRKFADSVALYRYFEDVNNAEVKKELLRQYIQDFYQRHEIAPCQMELCTLPLYPNLLMVEKFIPYQQFCLENKMAIRFSYGVDYSQGLPVRKINADQLSIITDTREQSPLRYYNSIRGKLDFGDYALSGNLHDGVYVERKGIADFWSTMAGAISKDGSLTRFQRELERARAAHAYVVILCEYDLHLLDRYKGYGYATHAFISHAMRNIFRQYADSCQFVFTINREVSAKLLVEFLLCGQEIRKYDLQLWVDKHYPPFREQEFTPEDLNSLFKV